MCIIKYNEKVVLKVLHSFLLKNRNIIDNEKFNNIRLNLRLNTKSTTIYTGKLNYKNFYMNNEPEKPENIEIIKITGSDIKNLK
jgi:hypothetical protein